MQSVVYKIMCPAKKEHLRNLRNSSLSACSSHKHLCTPIPGEGEEGVRRREGVGRRDRVKGKIRSWEEGRREKREGRSGEEERRW